jgi:hypothetical protein
MRNSRRAQRGSGAEATDKELELEENRSLRLSTTLGLSETFLEPEPVVLSFLKVLSSI